MQYQKPLRFHAATTSSQESIAPEQEPEQVARDTSRPPPLVRPDRHIVYDDPNPSTWPAADALGDHDTLTVDRTKTGMDWRVRDLVSCERSHGMQGWLGSRHQVEHVLRTVGADTDEEGRVLLYTEAVFCGLDGGLVIPPGTEYSVAGQRAHLVALLSTTSYGIAVTVLR